MNRQLCPMTFNIDPENDNESSYECVKEHCAWWNKDAQSCAIAVIAENVRRIPKK